METIANQIAGRFRPVALTVLVLFCLLCLGGADAQAYSTYFRFTGAVSSFGGGVSSRIPLSVGEQMDFLFRIETQEHGTTTRANGEVVDQGNLSRYVEYLGGDAILRQDFNAKTDYSDSTYVEYNYFKFDINLANDSHAYSEGASNLITLSSSITGSLSNWIEAVGSSAFSLHQFFAYDDTTSGGVYYIDTLTLVEVEDSLDKMNLTGIAMKSTATPIPGAIWLLGAGVVGLVGVRRRSAGLASPA